MANFTKRIKIFLHQNKIGAFSIGIILIIILIAILAPKIATYDPIRQDFREILRPPNGSHWFGTDHLGRDIFSRVIYGTRISLIVSLFAVLVGMSMGVSIGLFTGYCGGILDFFGMRIIDYLLCFPGILLAILISGIFGTGIIPVILAIGTWSIPTFARITRGSTLVIREKEYIEAEKAQGANMIRIMFRHVLPNIAGPIIVYATLRMGSAILATAYLSFLGVGVSPPTPEWGLMVSEAKNYMREGPWEIYFPGLAIFITVLTFNVLGDTMRDFLDVKQY